MAASSRKHALDKTESIHTHMQKKTSPYMKSFKYIL